MRALPRVVRALASSARAPTLAAMAAACSARPLRLREAVGHHQQVLRERGEHPRPLRRRLGRYQPHRLLLLAERGRVAEHAKAACELLVEQASPLRLACLVDQRQRLADQLRGMGGVAGRIGRLGAARQQQRTVHAGTLLGVRHPLPQP
jgi:hypothetical protein